MFGFVPYTRKEQVSLNCPKIKLAPKPGLKILGREGYQRTEGRTELR